MKRCWLGTALLALMLALGLLSGACLRRFGTELSRETARAAALADTDRPRAEEILRQTRQRWEEKRLLLSVLSDHGPIHEADTLFALLESPSEADRFPENALRLTRLLEDLARSQLPTWENVL